MSIPERKDVNFADTWALTDLYGATPNGMRIFSGTRII